MVGQTLHPSGTCLKYAFWPRLEQFQRKWEPVSRPELRKNVRVERFR